MTPRPRTRQGGRRETSWSCSPRLGLGRIGSASWRSPMLEQRFKAFMHQLITKGSLGVSNLSKAHITEIVIVETLYVTTNITEA